MAFVPAPAEAASPTDEFDASRQAALRRLAAFAAGPARDYASRRNVDLGPNVRSTVSRLSPYVRHRIITEREVIDAVLRLHAPAAASKFVQEVFWRSYWKGWLELRPAVWSGYRDELAAALAGHARGARASDYARACEGRTGIDCFDAWVDELTTTGYLHNHARMGFASIWTHTLGLPWQLGADLFLRRLLDGDPASNTLSWRWVVGLQTAGKVYLARPQIIAKTSGGRFSPRGLAESAPVPPRAEASAPRALQPLPAPPRQPAALLLTEEDLLPEDLVGDATIAGVGVAHATDDRSPQPVAGAVRAFVEAAQGDALSRATRHFGCAGETLPEFSADAVIAWCGRLGVRCILTPYAPVGPAQDRLRAIAPALGAAGIKVFAVRRAWDDVIWPQAQRGFFAFAKYIPQWLDDGRLFANDDRRCAAQAPA
jgi:hypothetical protein